MLAIGFRFPAGRYHATPWGRHVNEADVEWPPAPWRILRSLIATWHRKLPKSEQDPEILARLIEQLASDLPSYALPNATRAHVRHYMPVRQGSRDRSVLVFDAFVKVAPHDQLVALWPKVDALDADLETLLDRLLPDLGFLGRAESWVEAQRLRHWSGDPNCTPSELGIDPETGDALEPIRLLAPTPPEQYAEWRSHMVDSLELHAGKLSKAKRLIKSTLPEHLVDALQNESSDLQAAGWSSPPGARYVTYQRPYECFTPQRRRLGIRRSKASTVTSARLLLNGKPLPRIEDAVKIGELVRKAAVHHAEKVTGKNRVPSTLSGHGLPANNCHAHAFYLPEDCNNNGLIDRVLIHAANGLSDEALRALDSISSLWLPDGSRWSILLEQYGPVTTLSDCRYLGRSRQWESATPYLHPWHRKKHFSVEDQIRRECRERGLGEPELEPLTTIRIKGRNRRAVHFHRFRSKSGLVQADTHGSFWRLHFSNPVAGPLALGFGCHFGLGMFYPTRSNDRRNAG